MATRCPLCKAGFLSLTRRDLAYEGKVLAGEAYSCPACRETVLDGDQLEKLRDAVRRAGLASTEAEVDRVVERVIIQAS